MNRLFRFPAILLFVMFLVSTSAHASEPYSGCGTLYESSGCMIFYPLDNPSPDSSLQIDYTGGFSTFDTIYVSGTVDFDCQDPCGDVIGCLCADTVAYCGDPTDDYYFEALGVLVEVDTFTLFAPAGDTLTLFELEFLGGFSAGDTVSVAGFLNSSCQPSSPQAMGCIFDNTITLANQAGSPISGNAVIKTVSETTLDSVLTVYNGSRIDSIGVSGTYLIGFSDTIPTYSLMNELVNNPDIVMAEPNFKLGVPENLQMSISFPDEQAPSHIPGSSPQAYYDQGGCDALNLDEALQMTSGHDVRIAVIDNGFDLDHPLLSGRFTPDGYDYLDEDDDPSPDTGTVFEHGTFVSGLITLVAPDCSIVPFRAFDGNGIGSSFAIAQAIHRCVELDIDVINMSFGMHDPSVLVQEACSLANAAGITLVAAAGNDGTMVPVYPAALPSVIAVGALDTLENIASFSNFGGFIDVCAPGISIYSSLTGEWDWGYWSGTSFSAAFVSATCALVLSNGASLTNSEVRTLINSTARDELVWGTISALPDSCYGYGCVNAADAVLDAGSAGWLCGDVDNSGNIDIDDVTFLITYLYEGGEAPDPLFTGDTNCSSDVDVDDIVYLIEFIFSAGPEPCCL